MLKIGVFGGSFDPIHNAHLQMAQEALECLSLDRVYFIPCNTPNNGKTNLSTAEHRAEMVYLATENNNQFILDMTEIQRGGMSYTVDTLERLDKYHMSAQLYLIMGYDEIKIFDKWKDPDRIAELAKLVGFWRGPHDIIGNEHYLIEKYNFNMLDIKHDISATLIRDKVRENKSIQYLVPEKVRIYIKKNKLYQEPSEEKSATELAREIYGDIIIAAEYAKKDNK